MIEQNYVELKPAHGRDYKTKKEVEAAFREGKDFKGDYSIEFKLCSVRDFKPGKKVLLRYKGNSLITIVTV